MDKQHGLKSPATTWPHSIFILYNNLNVEVNCLLFYNNVQDYIAGCRKSIQFAVLHTQKIITWVDSTNSHNLNTIFTMYLKVQGKVSDQWYSIYIIIIFMYTLWILFILVKSSFYYNQSWNCTLTCNFSLSNAELGWLGPYFAVQDFLFLFLSNYHLSWFQQMSHLEYNLSQCTGKCKTKVSDEWM